MWVGLAGVLVGGLVGCGGPADEGRLVLAASDFADDTAPITVPLSEPTEVTAAGPAASTTLTAATAGTATASSAAARAEALLGSSAARGTGESPLPLVARPGRPDDGATRGVDPEAAPLPEGVIARGGGGGLPDEVLVEAKLGDINGRPVYAESFLGPLAGRLAAEAEVMSPREWGVFASRLINDRMQLIVRDELLRAEALSKLTTQQKQGVRALISEMRDNLISANYGSAALAETALLEERGLTSSEFLAQEEATLFVNETLNTQIRSRVQVSWRDVRQRYERDIEMYQRPPLATFRVLAVRSGDVETVTAELARGTAFAELAEGPMNRYDPASGGRIEVELLEEDGGPELFGADVINELAVGLAPGLWAGPAEFGSRTYWVLLESVEDRSVGLYDAQLDIEREIRAVRNNQESQRLFAELTNGPIQRALDQLHMKLLAVAYERYGPEG